jgi:hypothetical protein
MLAIRKYAMRQGHQSDTPARRGYVGVNRPRRNVEVVTIRMPAELVASIAASAGATGKTKSAWLRDAVTSIVSAQSVTCQ